MGWKLPNCKTRPGYEGRPSTRAISNYPRAQKLPLLRMLWGSWAITSLYIPVQTINIVTPCLAMMDACEGHFKQGIFQQIGGAVVDAFDAYKLPSGAHASTFLPI